MVPILHQNHDKNRGNHAVVAYLKRVNYQMATDRHVFDRHLHLITGRDCSSCQDIDKIFIRKNQIEVGDRSANQNNPEISP